MCMVCFFKLILNQYIFICTLLLAKNVCTVWSYILLLCDNLKVGNFEKKVAEMYGIGVQVANSDNTKLADDNITLVASGK